MHLLAMISQTNWSHGFNLLYQIRIKKKQQPIKGVFFSQFDGQYTYTYVSKQITVFLLI